MSVLARSVRGELALAARTRKGWWRRPKREHAQLRAGWVGEARRAQLTAIMLALALALAAAAIAAGEDTLLLHTVHPTDPNAVCNDGSAP